jgi:hypothetical protein
MSEIREVYRVSAPGSHATEVNRIFALLANRIDELEGRRGTPTFYDHLDLKDNKATNAGAPSDPTDLARRDEVAGVAHQNDTDNPHEVIASQVTVTPVGSVAATDAQAAIEELDTEKSSTSHAHADLSAALDNLRRYDFMMS